MNLEMKHKSESKVVGSPQYIAPEVHYKDYDERCDIWSLGVLLYTMSLKNAPFEGDYAAQVAENVKKINFIKGT